MTLVHQVLSRCQLQINALRLENDTDFPAQATRILRGIVSENDGTTGNGDHQGRKDPKERCFSASVRAEESKQLRGPNVKGDAIQCGALAVAVHNVTYSNGGRADFFRSSGSGYGEGWCVGGQR